MNIALLVFIGLVWFFVGLVIGWCLCSKAWLTEHRKTADVIEQSLLKCGEIPLKFHRGRLVR
jgi:uncharacterized membrane protein YciS (DUF1049 family)